MFQQWALCKVAASLWIMLFPDLSEKQHSSQLSLCQAHRPRNIIRGDILAGSLCQAWGKGFVLRKHDQKFNKWNCIQTRMLIQRCREEARRQGCTPTLWLHSSALPSPVSMSVIYLVCKYTKVKSLLYSSIPQGRFYHTIEVL